MTPLFLLEVAQDENQKVRHCVTRFIDGSPLAGEAISICAVVDTMQHGIHLLGVGRSGEKRPKWGEQQAGDVA